MPVSLLEAVAAGVPVVATAVGDIPKLIVHGETGLIIDRGDTEGLASALLSLAEDPGRRAALAAAARRRLAEVYSSKKMYEMYDRVYAQIQPARFGALTSSR